MGTGTGTGEQSRVTSIQGREMWTLSDRELEWLSAPVLEDQWVSWAERAAARVELERRRAERRAEDVEWASPVDGWLVAAGVAALVLAGVVFL